MAQLRMHWPVLLWAFVSLVLAHFHEPWRDEAQAWLVARHAQGLWDLLHRASIEASGPLYYLLLWPPAQLFPDAFPTAIFWVSWVGTLLMVWRLSEWDLTPFALLLILSGFLALYEYSAVARLYGWGGFFLLSGIRADKKGRYRLASVWLAAACLTQLTFWIAVLTWRLSRWRDGLILRHHGLVAAALALALIHLSWGAALRPWVPPGWDGFGFISLGSTLGTLILPFPQPLGILGYAVFLLGVWVLPVGRRLPFLVGALLYIGLFSFAYGGTAQGRHGGALYWLWLGWSVWGKHPRWVTVLLVASTLGSAKAWVQDISRPYSHGVAAADFIRQDGGGQLSVVQDMYGFVAAARLGQGLVGPEGPLGCPFFEGTCGAPPPPKKGPACDGSRWYHIAHLPGALPPNVPSGQWNSVWAGTGDPLSDERLQVYRLQCQL